MTSPSPLLFDTCYHIYNRGTNGENIFIQERNYEHFLKLYEKHISPIADTFAYCMLRNHFHIAVRIKSKEEILKTLRVSSSNQKSSQAKRFRQPRYKSVEKTLRVYDSRRLRQPTLLEFLQRLRQEYQHCLFTDREFF